jgi:uncharacterized protein YwgA
MNVTNITDRINQLCILLSELGGVIDGRKKLQKIVFIASELGQLPHQYRDFDWNYYGVYSYELANDIDIADRLQYLNEVEQVEGSNTSYRYQLAERGKEIAASFKLNPELKSLFSNMDARFLEVLSSIFYFAKKYDDDKTIRDLLTKFKGHLSSYFDEAFEAFRELKKAT